jgi:hypothetical protein
MVAQLCLHEVSIKILQIQVKLRSTHSLRRV